jgi:hypothetical protein
MTWSKGVVNNVETADWKRRNMPDTEVAAAVTLADGPADDDEPLLAAPDALLLEGGEDDDLVGKAERSKSGG